MEGGRELCTTIIHPAEMVGLDELGIVGNCFVSFSTFTVKEGLNTKNDQINHNQCILYTS